MTRLYIFVDDSMEGRKYLTAGNVRGTNYLATELKKLGLEPAGDSGTYFQTLPYDPSKGQHPGRNVLAILRGSDPKLNQTYVAIGAHNDHVGVRSSALDHDSVRTFALLNQERLQRATPDRAGNLIVNVDSLRKLRPARRDSIANGADDDGSGSVVVLEIAEALAKLPAKLKRSILFAFHTGEEAGLVGSTYLLEHPTVPRDSIIAYINLDMIGRGGARDASDDGATALTAIGARRLSSELGELVETVNIHHGHNIRLESSMDVPTQGLDGFGNSDHAVYAKHGIPVVSFFTGYHADYHSVTDEPQYIEYPHLAKITNYVYDLILALGFRPTRPAADSMGYRKADFYGKYPAGASADAMNARISLAAAQVISFARLRTVHDKQRIALLDSLGSSGAATDTSSTRRVLQLIARQLGEYRAVLTAEQQPAFDAGVRTWLKQREGEGSRVVVPGVVP